MKALESPRRPKGYKLAQLCRAAGVHPSTIHYYMKIGLLHRPKKVGLGLYLYDDTHLKKLESIRALRETENLSLSKIKARLGGGRQPGAQRVTGSEPETRPEETESRQAIRISGPTESIREKILDAATGLFSSKGYEGTTIHEVTGAVGMSKGAFYLYFQDKRGLFIACIDRLAHEIVPEESWQEISRETDFMARQRKRASGFLEAFPSYAGILHLVKMAASAEDPGLAEKAREAFARIVNPFLWDFRRAVADGVVRQMDAEFFGYVVLGMLENIGYKRLADPKSDLQECIERLMDILARGILPRSNTLAPTDEPRRRSGTITDVTGEKIKVREICFGGKPYLAGRIGGGEIRLDTERIAFILVDHAAPGCTAEVTMTDGEKTVLEQDSNLILSAASSVGLYAIPFRRLRSISFL